MQDVGKESAHKYKMLSKQMRYRADVEDIWANVQSNMILPFIIIVYFYFHHHY